MTVPALSTAMVPKVSILVGPGRLMCTMAGSAERNRSPTRRADTRFCVRANGQEDGQSKLPTDLVLRTVCVPERLR
jgi:hypothetical protein